MTSGSASDVPGILYLDIYSYECVLIKSITILSNVNYGPILTLKVLSKIVADNILILLIIIFQRK